jgi:hypothetical protein
VLGKAFRGGLVERTSSEIKRFGISKKINDVVVLKEMYRTVF